MVVHAHGNRIMAASLNALSRHGGDLGKMTLRRHLPIWITSGMLVPDGACHILNVPFASVSAAATGWPEIGESQWSQEAPRGDGRDAVLGT